MPQHDKSTLPVVSAAHLEAICKAFAEDPGLSHREIAQVLQQCRINNVDSDGPRWKRLYNALATRVNTDGHSSCVLSFVAHALAPARFASREELFQVLRDRVNVSLAFIGLSLGEEGRFYKTVRAMTVSEAQLRADSLRRKLEARGVHADVLKYCTAELVEDNYFHAVLEATKSIASKLRQRSGETGDGSPLVDSTLSGRNPILRINDLQTDSHASEQSGFANFLKGIFGMFRNTTAHAARIEWSMMEEDALDLLVLASYAHRRLDRATRRP